MRAIVRDRYGGTDVLRLDEVETPVPGDGEVLARVRAASINTADLDHIRGQPRIARIGTGLFKPKSRIPGLDVSGEVEAVGRGVTRFVPGDEIWGDMFAHGSGAFAEYVCAPETAFQPKPAGLTFQEAASVPHSAVLAFQGLGGRRRIRPEMKVLINGAGGCVGPFALQIAKTLGAEVTAVDHTAKLDMLRSIGADHVIDYTRVDVTRNGRRYDFILDIAANRPVFAYRRVLTDGGAYVQIARTLRGFFGAAAIGGLISMAGNKRLGIFMWAPNRKEDLEQLRVLVEAGDLKPLVDRAYPLSAVPAAVRYLEDGHARGKVVVTI